MLFQIEVARETRSKFPPPPPKKKNENNNPISFDLTHETHHPCTRFRIDGIKAMSRGISGNKQKMKFANAWDRGRLYLFSKTQNDELIVMQNVRLEFRQN